ncbi:unnamed protein product [Callosobruchus maculatus]|uniref:Uncharacterized protein n=1 Tax=Callosobruchus maculatus TaxID=64391 RepID=A0A653BT37_CALMS|nr:unnamed protein product [Callosobruchus maculatus]
MLPCFVCNAGGIIHVHILLFYTKCNYLYCDNSDLLQLVDSLLRTDPSNGLREAASRQLEVFRSKGPVDPGGTATATGTTVHVVRCSRTSLMASTSSTITASTGVSVPTPQAHHVTDGSFIEDFHNLQLSVNPLDVTASKSKAVVCRGASRRPPTRQRSLRRCTQTTDEGGGGGGGAGTSSANATATAAAAAVNLRRVSRLCHQIHASAVRQAFGTVTAPTAANLPTPAKPDADATAAPPNTVEIVELESSSSDVPNAAPHTNLVRTKSSSSEDIHTLSESLNKSLEDLDDFEQLQTWRRTSKIRRSLQFPKQNRQKTNNANKPVDIPERSVSVKKIKEDLEKGRRLNTVLRNNSVDLDALDHILQSISGSSGVDRNLEDTDESESNKKVKRNSFVTVESIQEVKGRLRRTSSPSSDIYKENGGKELDLESADDADDGIVVEEESCSAGQPKTAETTSRVRSYVYGMEAALLLNNKKSAACTGTTGSLESRVKLVNGNGNFSVKNEDWYNRRKSYGFEQVHAQEESSNCILKSRKQVESSTDSGICRSSELMHKTTNNAYNENHFGVENSDSDHKFNGWKEITTGQVKKLASTYDSTRSGAGGGGTGEVKSTTTITIPIVKNNNVVDLPWYDHHHHGGGIEIKRHSIAVDESRYVRRVAGDQEGRHRRTSLVANTAPASTASAGTAYFEPLEDDANAVAGRRIKKVEFCKTEVHFTAESGKVNIVATDEKPPPTQNFRRRRRTTCSSSSGPLGATAPEELLGGGSGLPVLRFGDSSEEQTMFAVGDGTAAKAASPPRPPHSRLDADVTSPHPPPQVGVVTVNATAPDHDDASASCLQNESTASEGNADDISENEIKGILKNKPTQPIPYHLGEEVVRATSPTPIVTYPSSSDEDTSKWGVKLRHVPKRPPTVPAPTSEAPPLSMWKSTVTVRNLYEKNNGQDKIQQRLRSLRPTTKNAATDTIDPSTEGHRGYSTKINFGEGQATVVKEEEEKVDDDRRWGRQAKERLANTIWSRPSADESHLPLYKDSSLAVHGKTGDSTKARDQEECRTAHCRLSPVRNAEHWPPVTPDLTPVEKLSSPFLVGKTGVQSSRTTAIAAPDNIVLRQPKKSEMTYFGIKVSPSPKKKVSQATIRKETKLFTEKPDLLQHHAAKSISPTRSKFNKPRQKTPEPIYENVHAGAANDNKYRGREFDASGILDELTKAADQILQAVNGYTDEDTKQSTDEEKQKLETIDEAKSWKQTASSTNEAKSASNVKSKLKHTSSTSSVESITKKGKNATTPTTERRQQYRSSSQQTKEKKQDSRSDISCSTSSKTAAMTAVNANANSKANRRLQRANSREALLHSHGSSSEDLPNRTKASVRKPRLVKKTKAVQLTMSNGLEMKKKTGTKNSGGSSTGNIAAPREKKERLATTAKADERILNSLPEIRHKTAFSTIRSTSEKVTKDRAKYKHEDIKKKTPSKRDTPSRGGSTAAETASPTCIGDNSKCDRTAAAAASTDNSINQCSTTPTETKGDRRHRPAVTGAPAVTQHRISTANIKKCCSSNSGRSEGVKP